MEITKKALANLKKLMVEEENEGKFLRVTMQGFG